MEGYVQTPLRIVLVGKSGDGKSSAGNTILGEEAFKESNSPDSGTVTCQSRTDKDNRITVIDTPELFDTKRKEEEVVEEILKCLGECSPGPHAFVIVLRAGRYTDQEQQVLEKLLGLFGEEALKFTLMVFTRGDDLQDDERIEQFVEQNSQLKRFVDNCGGRCHVIDSKYWKKTKHEYRNNKVQVEKIINTVQTIVKNNGGRCYTNEMLKTVQAKIEEEEQRLRQEQNTDMSDEEIRGAAKKNVLPFLLQYIAMSIKALLKKFMG